MSATLVDVPVAVNDLGEIIRALQYACGRNRLSLKKRHRKYICQHLVSLQLVADLSGVPHTDRAVEGDELSA